MSKTDKLTRLSIPVHSFKYPAFFFVLITFLFLACKTKQIVKLPVANQAAPDVLIKINNNAFNPEWFSCKARINISKDENNTVIIANIRTRKDSIIWISVSSLIGIEVARMLMNKDSIFVMDRLKQHYYANDYKYLTTFIPFSINFEQLITMIYGNIYIDKKFKADVINEENSFLVKQQTDDLLIKSWVNSDLMIQQISIKHKFLQYSADISFDEFKFFEEKSLPHSVKYNFVSNDTTNISVEYNNVNINEPQKFPFSIPVKYKKAP